MRASCPPGSSRSREGFTLVEMLVAIAIFALLATISISAFGERGDDRVPAAARQVRSMISGAQSRAARDNLPRGIRLLVDANSTASSALVTGLIYIAANRDVTGTLEKQIFAPSTTPQHHLVPTGQGWEILQPSSETRTWKGLRDDNLLLVGQKIRISWPSSTGVFFIRSFPSDTKMLIVGPEAPPSLKQVTGYTLELAPGVLEGSEPVPFPLGTVIDLDASAIPDSFRPGMMGSYSSIDILFSARGTLISPIGNEGLIHLYVGEQTDSLLGITARPVTPISSLPLTISSAAGPRRVVTIIPSTGQVVPSEYTNNTFPQARLGQEAK